MQPPDIEREVPPSHVPLRAYAVPRLRVYGDIVALTRAISNTSHNADGGSMAQSKTA